jgi:serine/threonine protein phosphatase PrpC
VLTARARTDTSAGFPIKRIQAVLLASGATDKGRVRPVNEDWWAFEQSHGLCVVADGVGGHKAGEVAARLAVETVIDFLTGELPGRAVTEWPFGFDPSVSPAGNRLRTAIQLAHMRILETAVTSDQYAGMGTTIVASTVNGDRLSVGHAGDSRLYVLAGDRLRQVTQDDSWMATMLAQDPAADRGRYEQHPMRDALTNVVGARRRTDVHVVEETLQGGELLLLTTDGVHGVLDEDRIEQLLIDAAAAGDVQRMAENLVAAALARGSHDNCTALVARYFKD